MAVTVSDVTSPVGELDAALLFPHEDEAALTTRITAYIAQGVTEAADVASADQDAAVTQWVYYRAYDAVWQRLAAQPISLTLSDQGSKTFGAAQADRFRALADAKRAAFDAYLAPTQLTEPTAVSRARPIQTVW